MNTTTIIMGLILILLVARQFTEQAVNWRSLLLLPIIAAGACYIDLHWAFVHFAPSLLSIGLIAGILAGLATGIIRGQQARLRLDDASGTLFVKPELVSSYIWAGVGVVRIVVLLLTSGNLEQQNILVGILAAFGGMLFLVSISTQRFILFLQSNRYRANPPQPQPLQGNAL